LQQEIHWLENAHRYLAALSAPFSTTQLRSWAELQQISNQIRDRVRVPADAKVHANTKAIFEGIVSALSAIPTKHIGHAVHAAETLYKTIIELVEINGHHEAAEAFQSTADEVGVKLAERLNAARAMLERQLPNVVASDYRKLKIVGSCASGNPAEWKDCPFDHADWQFTQDDQEEAAEALKPATQIWAYGELLPAKYNAWRLPVWWRKQVTDQFRGKGVVAFFHPFKGEPETAQVAEPIFRNIPTYTHTTHRKDGGDLFYSLGDLWQITALGYLEGEGTFTSPWVMHLPEAAVTNTLFKPVMDGGLGVDKEKFFDLHFKAKSLDHYPEKDTPTGWCAAEFFEDGCQ
jgi:hypothetical protein